MFLNTLTIIIHSLVLVVFLGLLQLWLWWQDRKLVVLGIWGGAHLFGAAGLVLMASRGLIPNRLSIDIAVAILVASYGIIWLGARQFERRRISVAAALAGSVIWLIACQVPVFYADVINRAVMISALVAVYDALSAREFLRRRPGSSLPSRRSLAVLFCADALTHVVRIGLVTMVGLDQTVYPLPGSTSFGLTAMLGSVLAIGTSVLLIAVAKEQGEQESTTILAMARDSADQASVAKSRFLARVSHELRTPLNGVLGIAQIMARDPSLHGLQRERAIRLKQAGRHLLSMVNDILDLARIEADKFEVSPQPVLVSDLVSGSVDLLQETAAAKSVTLNVDFDRDVPAAVFADPLRVRQILVNLLGNAVKFAPKDGLVTLSVSWLYPTGGLRLSVADNGPGVPDEIRPYLFQDFAQRPANAASPEGTGLGLAISAALAQTMRGTISYRPGPDDVGSLFVVDLPLPAVSAPSETLTRTAPLTSLPQTDRRVLVVDDVEANRSVADALLRSAGFSVELVSDGATALAMLERGNVPDVVLMDVHMPGIDGLTAARQIRALPCAAARVPIIALTGEEPTDSAREYYRAGMNAYVTKPIELDELVATISQVLQRETAT